MLKGDTFYKSHYSIFGIRVEFPGCKWSLDGPIINIWDPQAAALREHSPLQPYRSASPESSALRSIGSNHTKLWQIHANACKYDRNLPEHQYSFDISVVLQKHFLPSSRKEHWRAEFPTSFFSKSKGMSSTQRSWKVWQNVWESFGLGAVGWKK